LRRALGGCALSLLGLVWATVPAGGQEREYAFLGDVRGQERVRGGVEIRAAGGLVRIEQLRGVGFRLRYAFGHPLAPLHSYATVESLPPLLDPEVRDTPDSLVLTGDVLRVVVRKRPLRVAVWQRDGTELFRESLGAGHEGSHLAHLLVREPGTRYFGLGEQATALERSGGTFPLWNTDHPAYRPGDGPLYTSFPFYIAVRSGVAFGLFYDNSSRALFDFSARLDGQVGYFAAGGELRYYVLAGPALGGVLARYTALTGRTPLPPRWALGYQQSRWSYYPAAELERLAAEFRGRRIPCDVLYLDIDYLDGYRVFTWSPGRFPDPRGLLAALAAHGFKVVTIVDPGVKVDSAYPVYREGAAAGAYVRWPDGRDYVGEVWPGPVVFPDFSRPATRRWWGDLHRALLDVGVSGIWDDMNEPTVFGGGTMPDVVRFDDEGRGASHLELHNVYGLLMARATYEGVRRLAPERRPFVLTRAGFSGVQRYAAVWTGDNVATWEHLRLAIPMVLGLGLAGVPFAGVDMGGFAGSPDGALYTRFLQLGAFLPLFRTHSEFTSARREPWSFGPVYERANRAIIELRYRLLPVLYTAFFQHARDGRPVVRPLLWEVPHDTTALAVDDEFVLGDHLLVAPVTLPGAGERTLYLPPGRWYRWHSDEAYGGGRWVTVPAPAVNPADRDDANGVRGIPVFVRAGAVLPLAAVRQYVGEPAADTITLHVYDGGAGESELYEDDGAGYGYARGDYRLLRFRTATADSALRLRVTLEGRAARGVPRFPVVVHGLARAPRQVTTDGAATPFEFDPAARLLAFDLVPGDREVQVLK
jgi:alpha-glucosidase